MTTVIYGLSARVNGPIRYIGKSCGPILRRTCGHVSTARRGRVSTPIGVWVRFLLRNGMRPVPRVLEIVEGERWQDAERRWIAKLRKDGFRLLNIHNGGNGAHTHAKLKKELVPLLGVISDARIAEMAGLCRESITYHRRQAGIAASKDYTRSTAATRARMAGKPALNRIVLPPEIVSRLGVCSDYSLSKLVNTTKQSIAAYRRRLGIPPYSGPKNMPRGEKHHRTSCTDAQVREIRKLRTGGMQGVDIAKRYKISPSTVSRIVTRATWNES